MRREKGKKNSRKHQPPVFHKAYPDLSLTRLQVRGIVVVPQKIILGPIR